MPTVKEVQVPDIGDLTDVPVIEILVAKGDKVNEGDSLLVLESDKATLEVPSDVTGTVVEITVSENDTVNQGTPIATVAVSAEPGPEVTSTASPPTATPADTPGTSIPPADVSDTSPENTTTTTTPLQTTPDPAGTPDTDDQAINTDIPAYAPPSVRKLARELGIGIASVTGTGPKNRITKDDVKQFVKAQLTGNPAGSPTQLSATLAAFPEWPQVDHKKYGPVDKVDLNRIARKSGPALARNAMLIPHVTYFDKTDITDTDTFRQQLNNEATEDDAKITLLSFAIKAVVSALKTYPVFNSSLEGEQLIIKKYWNIGVAVDTPNGLLVPVIKTADKKGVREIGNEIAQLAEAARGGALSPKDMQGATFTISSLGSIGGTNFTPIINAPEVAILGIPRSEIQPVWDGEAFQPRKIQPLSLSFDHRVTDGGEAARFVSAVCKGLNDFRRTAV